MKPKRVRLTSRDKQVLVNLIVSRHRELMVKFEQVTKDTSRMPLERNIMLRHYTEQLEPLEHAAAAFGVNL